MSQNEPADLPALSLLRELGEKDRRLGGRRVRLSGLRARDVIGGGQLFDSAEASTTVAAKDFAVLWSSPRAARDAFRSHHPVVSGKLLVSNATTPRRKPHRTSDKPVRQQQLANS